MLVDVVLLRLRGRKLDRDQLRAPVRGMLQVDTCGAIRTADHHETPRLAVLVKPGVAESLLPPLLFARLGKLRGWQFVIVGMEEEGTWRKYPPRHRQAWWCRVVREAPGEPAPAPVAAAAARQDIEREHLAEPA